MCCLHVNLKQNVTSSHTFDCNCNNCNVILPKDFGSNGVLKNLNQFKGRISEANWFDNDPFIIRWTCPHMYRLQFTVFDFNSSTVVGVPGALF